MRISKAPAWLVGAFLVAALPGASARADSLALMNTSGTPTIGPTVSMGFSFTTNQAITIDALADVIDPGPSSQVRLYDGTGTILAEATVTTSDPHPYSIPFGGVGLPGTLPLYVAAITPVTLAADTTYYIAADTPNNASFISQLGGLTTDPSITYGHGVSVFGLGNDPFTDSTGLPPGYLGPDFIIGTTAVPEPSSIILSGFAVIGVMVYMRRGR